jgi:hypothetical protein
MSTPDRSRLSKRQAQAGRLRIEQYYQEKLAVLQSHLHEAMNECRRGNITVFELDHIIHVYHTQSQELFSFINMYYGSNSTLPTLLAMIDSEAKGEWLWEPTATLLQ